MEKIMFILLGLMVLTLIKRRMEMINLSILNFSTSSITNCGRSNRNSEYSTNFGMSYDRDCREKKAQSPEEKAEQEEDELINSLSEAQLLKEQKQLEKRLRKITKRQLEEEKVKLEKRLKELENEMRL